MDSFEGENCWIYLLEWIKYLFAHWLRIGDGCTEETVPFQPP